MATRRPISGPGMNRQGPATSTGDGGSVDSTHTPPPMPGVSGRAPVFGTRGGGSTTGGAVRGRMVRCVVRRRVGVGVAGGDAEAVGAGTREGVPEAKAVDVLVGCGGADADADPDADPETDAATEAEARAHGVAETDGDRPGDCDAVAEPTGVFGLTLVPGLTLVEGAGPVLVADRGEAEADEVEEADEVDEATVEGAGVLVTHGAGVGVSAPTAPMATRTEVVAAARAATRTAIARGIVRRAWSILGSPVRLGSGPVGGGSAYRG